LSAAQRTVCSRCKNEEIENFSRNWNRKLKMIRMHAETTLGCSVSGTLYKLESCIYIEVLDDDDDDDDDDDKTRLLTQCKLIQHSV
jgi:hypothetical protein